MQTFTATQSFSQSAAFVLGCYTTPGFLSEKYAALGRQDIEILKHHKDAKESRMSIRYSDKPDMELPDFARKLVPERALVEQSVVWDLAKKTGRIVVDAKGSPVKIIGEMLLEDTADGCTNTLHWQLSCSIPLLGGKIEKLLVQGLKAKSLLDERVSRKLLAAAGK